MEASDATLARLRQDHESVIAESAAHQGSDIADLVARAQAVDWDLHWTVIPSTGEKCSTPASAQVTPPDETDHITLTWPYGTVCGTIDGRPYAKSTQVAP